MPEQHYRCKYGDSEQFTSEIRSNDEQPGNSSKFLQRAARSGQLLFWIRDTDERGFPVDMRIVEAAFRKAQDLRRYRARDLRDDAVRSGLIETAVYRASRASRFDPIRDVNGYVFQVFKRLVDRELAQDRLVTPRDVGALDRFGWRKTAINSAMEKEILARELLALMNPQDRWAWERRLLGYELKEIATELNITPDCLSTRLRRAVTQVAHRLSID